MCREREFQLRQQSSQRLLRARNSQYDLELGLFILTPCQARLSQWVECILYTKEQVPSQRYTLEIVRRAIFASKDGSCIESVGFWYQHIEHCAFRQNLKWRLLIVGAVC